MNCTSQSFSLWNIWSNMESATVNITKISRGWQLFLYTCFYTYYKKRKVNFFSPLSVLSRDPFCLPPLSHFSLALSSWNERVRKQWGLTLKKKWIRSHECHLCENKWTQRSDVTLFRLIWTRINLLNFA